MEPYEIFISNEVVLDTAGTIIYIGTLVEVNAAGFVLENADVHDCRDGHANKEVYINEANTHGVSPNRELVLVLHSSVMSVSRLAHIVT